MNQGNRGSNDRGGGNWGWRNKSEGNRTSNNWNDYEAKRSNPPRTGHTCFNCGKSGHKKYDCPDAYNNKGTSVTTPHQTTPMSISSPHPQGVYDKQKNDVSKHAARIPPEEPTHHPTNSNYTPPESLPAQSITPSHSNLIAQQIESHATLSASPALTPPNNSNPATQAAPSSTPFNTPASSSSIAVHVESMDDKSTAPARAISVIQEGDYNHLPIAKYKKAILSAISAHQVVVISGATGSGKTTQVPKYLLEHTLAKREPCSIVCTQPRRLAATSIAKRVAHELHEPVGQSVGFQIGMDKVASSSTQLLFVTTGVLLQRLIHSKSLHPFTHIILDEVHERDLDTDFSLVIIKQLLVAHPTTRLILMSATFNCDMFAGYFPLTEVSVSFGEDPSYKYRLIMEGTNDERNSSPRGRKRERSPEKAPSGKSMHSPILSVGGRCFPSQVCHMEEIVRMMKGKLRDPMPNLSDCLKMYDTSPPTLEPNTMLLAAQLILQLDNAIVRTELDSGQREDNAVLVFLPGYGEIQELHDVIMQFNIPSLWLLPLHSTITTEEQARVFQKAAPGVRKVILSTNIAESSVTVPDIRYVVDFGFVKQVYFDPQTNLETLKLQWISKASAVQRQGRAGRVAPGVVFRMYTEDFFNLHMAEYSPSEMLRCPLESLVLQVKVMGESLEMLDKAIQRPKTEALDQALRNLRNAGGLDVQDRLTFLGRLYSSLPVDIKVSRLLLLGHVFGVLNEAIIMAATISVRSLFSRPFQQPLQAFTKKLEWARDCESDCVAALYAYEAWYNSNFRSVRDEKEWCRKNFVHFNTLKEAEDVIRELRGRLNGLGIILPHSSTVSSEEERVLLLKVIIFGAFYPNYFTGVFSDKREIDNTCNGAWNQIQCDPYRTVQLFSVPYNASEEKIKELMEKCGKVSGVTMAGSKCYVEFDASRAKESVLLAIKMGGMKKLLLEPEANPNNSQNDYDAHTSNGLGRVQWNNFQADKHKTQNSWNDTTASNCFASDDSSGWDPSDVGPVETETPHLIMHWQKFPEKVLGGPVHPFKLAFYTIANKELVFVEGNSVNSAAVDQSVAVRDKLGGEYSHTTPAPTANRFLVAAFVSNNSGGKMSRQMLRETTLLPPYPMIGELLAMTFSPNPEMFFWCNRRQTHFRGVSLDQFQMDLPFQFMLHASDLAMLNGFRKLISESLTRDGIRGNYAPRLRDALHKLLLKQRLPVKLRNRPFRQTEHENEASSRIANMRFGDSELLLFQTIIPCGQQLIPTNEETDYDSEEEERRKKFKMIEDVRRRIKVPESEEEDKLVVCGRCSATLCAVSALEKAPHLSANTFKLTRCFGNVFIEGDDTSGYYATCRNKHIIGFCVDGCKYIDEHAELMVTLPGGGCLQWVPEVWRNNFASIGGAAQQQTLPVVDLESQEALYCSICNFQCKTRRLFITHVTSSKHKEEERYLMES